MLPNLIPPDDEDSDEGDDAAAVAEVLLGRKPIPRFSNRRNSVRSEIKLGAALEEGQPREDEVCVHPLNKPSQEISTNSVAHPLGTSLLDRLGPPSQSTSLTSVSSSVRQNHSEQVEFQFPSNGASPLQPRDSKLLKLLPDDQKSSDEIRLSRSQKRPHSPRRRRNHSPSRSPNRSRYSPPPCDLRRRASLSARITLNQRRNSCSLDSFQLDLPPRSKRIARRFSSPSNSPHNRRDHRDRELPNSIRYPPNASSRVRPHPDLHPTCEPVVEEPIHFPISNVGSTSKSPSLNSPDTASTALSKPLKVSVLLANLPSYRVLTPKRLYEHLTDPIYRQRCQWAMPYELKLYRYARSECVVAELKFNSIDDARHFTQKVDRAWPPIWYSPKKLPAHSKLKNMDFTVLEDKTICWPSNYETYSPKIRSDSYCSTARFAEDGSVVSEQQPQDQVAQPPHVASSFDASAGSTSKLAQDMGASLPKIKSKSDCYRPKLRRHSPDPTGVAEERKNQPPSQSALDQCKPVANAMPIPINGCGSLSSQALKDTNASLAKVKLNADDGIVVEQQTSSTQPAAPTEEQQQYMSHAPTSVNVSEPMSKPARNTDLPPLMDPYSVSQKIPESSDSGLVKPLSITEMNEDSRSSVMLSKLHASLTWPVLQSHFLFPNRPRHFRIFEPFQVAYGSFFPADRIKSSIDEFTGSEEGCMISFSDTDTARNFCRVLQRNPPFQSVQIRLVDAADIEFVSSASIIRKSHDDEYVDSATANDTANQFLQNTILDFQNQLNWSPGIHSEIQSPVPTTMEISPLIPIPDPQFTSSNLGMQPSLGCSVYPFQYGNEYPSSMLRYPQSCSSVPVHYPYNPPSQNIQKNSPPKVQPEGLILTPNDTFEKNPSNQQELQDRLKKILQDRKAKLNR